MKVEGEVVSREFIKPSSPTPKHLLNYQLSYLDQISPPIYVPQIFFYNYNSSPKYAYDPEDNVEMSRHLKTSLSETLTRFYPLAGRLDDVDATSVRCNDEGVLFVEARVKTRLTDLVVDDPNLGDHNVFLPLNNHRDNTLLAIQANFFDCGGLAIGVCLSHKIADALSTIMFMSSWAKMSNHDDQMNISNPMFGSAKIFPPRDISRGLEMKEHNIVAKRFVFDHSMVESLRAKYSTTSAKNTNDDHEYPIFQATRVEALSAFIWSRYAAATHHQVDSSQLETLNIVTNAVSLRNIVTDPPLLSKSAFGNLYTTTAVAMNSRDNIGPWPHEPKLVRLMRAAKNKINEGYVKRLREGEGNSSVIGELLASYPKGQQIVRLSFSSWCWMPVYDADFGWGKPVRVSFAKLTLKNSVTFMDTRDGNGIEASINLDEQDMAKLETDREFLSYVSPIKHIYPKLN